MVDLLYHSGLGYYNNGDYTNAAERFRAAIDAAHSVRSDPKAVAELYAWLTEAYECFDYDKAEAAVQEGQAWLRSNDQVLGEEEALVANHGGLAAD